MYAITFPANGQLCMKKVFPSQTLIYDNGLWNKVQTKSGGYNYVMESIGMSARINTSMSSQLWTSVNESLIGSPTKLEIL